MNADRRTLWPTILLAVIAAATLWWTAPAWWQPPATQPPDAAAPPDAETAHVALPASAPSPADAIDASRKPVERSATPDPGPAQPTATDTIEILVVRAGEPVPGATVRFLDATRLRNDDLPFEESLAIGALVSDSFESLLTAIGEQTATDPKGRCRIPWTGPTLICARAEHPSDEAQSGEAQFGEAQLRRRPVDTVVVDLQPDRTLEVEVRAADGLPAVDIDVVIVSRAPDGSPVRAVRTATDAEGRARLRHVQRLSRGGVSDIAVTVAPLGGQLEPVPINPDAPPAERLRFTLPPTGSMTFRLVPAHADGRIALPHLTHDRMLTVHPHDDPSRTWTRLLDRDGIHHVAHVLPGCRLAARAGDLHLEPILVAGPPTAGEHVEAPLPIPGDGVVIAGRAVDAAGNPITRSTLHVFTQLDDIPYGGPLETDAHGAFAKELARLPAGHTPPIEFGLSATADRPSRLITLTPRAPLVAGRNDFGDVVFAAKQLLAAGTVVDDTGAPVAEPRLGLRRVTDAGTDWVFAELSIPEPGRFEIRGETDAGRLRLAAHGAHHLDPPVEFAPGTTDLHVVLTRVGSIGFGLRVDADTPWTQLSYGLVPAEGSTRDLVVETPGQVRGQIDNVPPGTYAFVVRTPDRRDVVSIPEVVVEAGSPTTDPRLQAIDIRALCRTVPLTVRGADGSVPAGVLALIEAHTGAAPRRYRAIEATADGLILVPVTDPVDAIVVAAGFQPARVAVADRPHTVVLEAAPDLTLHVDGLADLPTGLRAEARIAPTGDHPLAQAWHMERRADPRSPERYHRDVHAVLPAAWQPVVDGALRCTPIQPGPHEIALRLVHDTSRHVDIALGGAVAFDWTPGQTEHRITVPAEPLRTAIQAASR